jgi:hypothetical protein
MSSCTLNIHSQRECERISTALGSGLQKIDKICSDEKFKNVVIILSEKRTLYFCLDLKIVQEVAKSCFQAMQRTQSELSFIKKIKEQLTFGQFTIDIPNKEPTLMPLIGRTFPGVRGYFEISTSQKDHKRYLLFVDKKASQAAGIEFPKGEGFYPGSKC